MLFLLNVDINDQKNIFKMDSFIHETPVGYMFVRQTLHLD
jgi:hypothetical protein